MAASWAVTNQVSQTEVCAPSPKPRSLRFGAAEGICARVALAADAVLVEAEAPGKPQTPFPTAKHAEKAMRAIRDAGRRLRDNHRG